MATVAVEEVTARVPGAVLNVQGKQQQRLVQAVLRHDPGRVCDLVPFFLCLRPNLVLQLSYPFPQLRSSFLMDAPSA